MTKTKANLNVGHNEGWFLHTQNMHLLHSDCVAAKTQRQLLLQLLRDGDIPENAKDLE